MKAVFVLLLIVYSTRLYAQVDEIKKASSENSSSGKSGSDSFSDDDGGDGWFDFIFGGIGEWQSMKLQSDRERYPAMVSFDVMFQGGVKPSSYYMLWPRVRGNWGLFSTDFRMNYLLEEDEEGFKHIRTSDWQVIQLNLVTSKFFTFRFGTGFMKEAFNSKESFSESALMMGIHAPDQTKSLNFEYRFAIDFDTEVNPRNEFSVFYQHQFFQSGALHGYLTVGGVFQNYYETIEVWAVQGGIVFRFF